MGIAKAGNKIIIAKNNIKTQGIAKAGNIIYSAGPPQGLYILNGNNVSPYNMMISTNVNGEPGTYVDTIVPNDWERLAYYAPEIHSCTNYTCYNWSSGVGVPLNFEKLISIGDWFMYMCVFFNQSLIFPKLTTIGNNVLSNCSALSNVKISLGNVILNSTHTYFLSKISTTSNIITLELRAKQTITTRPSNMLNYRPNNSAVISGVDLRINKDSVGVNVANKTWAGMTFRSITLIDENGIAA